MMINDVYTCVCVCVDCYCWMVVYPSQVCLQFPSFFDDGTGINSGPPTKTSMLKFGEAYGESVCFWSNLFEMFLLAKSQLVNEMRLQFESAVLTDSSNVNHGKTMVESSAFRGFCHGSSR